VERAPEPAGVSSRPIKSFPSPPDPDFYGDPDDDELPSGTRRVSRLDRRPSKPRPVKRRRPHRPKRPSNGRGKRSHSWWGRAASLVALVVAAALIWFLVELFQPLGTSAHGHVTVRIPPHSGTDQIASLLAHDGVISSGFFFKLRATLAGERSDLRSGTYQLQQGMSYSSVLHILTKAPPAAKVTEVTITEGHTRQQVAQLLHTQKVQGNYLAQTRHSPLLNPRAYGARGNPPSLEGFLFPDTFQLVVPVKSSALIADQLRDFKKRFATVSLAYARRKHLTPYDVLKVASLVEAESATAHDRPLVASVIYNRLADGMMLQFDSTTRYATGNYNHPLTVSQLRSSSPWNTHTHFGLPPTPIDSPGLDAIQAAANPRQTRYLYFFAKPCTRGTVFATNYNEFLALGRRYAGKRC
ncbi:MAG: endolytic transglycosylase MltG, partial [Solirubrobacteraceae bacterium]